MMPPIYCITLKQTPDRHGRAVEYFRAAGLDVTFVWGVHGRTWGLETSLWAHGEAHGYKIAPGMVGLNLSHWMVWQLADLAGCEEFIVMEDDCLPCEDFREEYRLTREALPGDWAFCYLGTVGGEGRVKQHINERLVRFDDPYGTHCYLVRKQAVPVLLENMQEARGHTDQQLWQNVLSHGRLPFYVAWPSLAGQHSYEGRWEGACR